MIVVTLVAVALLLVGCGGSSVADQVSGSTGQSVSCNKIGVMFLAGKQSVVWSCWDESYATVGCFAEAGGGVVDVSSQFKLLAGSDSCS